MKTWKAFVILLMIAFCTGCSKEDDQAGGGGIPVVKTNVNGSVEKGPFLTGSKVTLYELDTSLRQTGKNIFKTETTNDNGDFSFDTKMELASKYAELEINGYFYNEVKDERSTSQITLSALADLSGDSEINVNILTHLEFKRVKNLVASGMRFDEAKKQAKQELLKVFYITLEIKNSENISLTDGDENASVLFAISSILLYDKSEAEFSEFMAKLSNDFAASGVISDHALLEEIRNGQMNVKAKKVTENLENYYKSQGKTVSFTNIRKYIDGNGDSVLDDNDENKLDNGLIPESFWTTEDHFKQALNICYVYVRDYAQRMAVLDAVRCNQINLDLVIDAYNPTVFDTWESAYRAIRQLNMVVEQEPTSADLSFDAKPYFATAKTLHAFLYADMVQHWGDVPFVVSTNLTNQSPSRTSKEKIFQALLLDLEGSLSALREMVDQSQIVLSRDFAYALMATIQLERGTNHLTEATTALKKIIDSGHFSVSVDNTIYNDMANKEALFSLLFKDDGASYYNLFTDNLKRGDLHPVYRYTGILLNYAEAMCQGNRIPEMLEAINQIRAAKGLPTLQEPVENPAKEIAHLWRSVIASDYGYFALLKRLNLAVEILNIEKYQQLYPIPAREMDLNSSMTQNPGYKK